MRYIGDTLKIKTLKEKDLKNWQLIEQMKF